MDELRALQALGISLPSPAALFAIFIFSIIGFAAYRYGAKMELPKPKWLGVLLMLYPYAVSETWLLYSIGVGLCAALIFWRD